MESSAGHFSIAVAALPSLALPIGDRRVGDMDLAPVGAAINGPPRGRLYTVRFGACTARRLTPAVGIGRSSPRSAMTHQFGSEGTSGRGSDTRKGWAT